MLGSAAMKRHSRKKREWRFSYYETGTRKTAPHRGEGQAARPARRVTKMSNLGMEQQNGKLFTVEGLKKMEDELEELKTVKRAEVAERIKVARSFGDLSENAEYDAAKNEQAFMEGRILELETILRGARVVSEDDVPFDLVTVGSIVRLRDEKTGKEVEYSLVGSSEADPMAMKISNESPIGTALFNKRLGDTVRVTVPAGVFDYSIVAVHR
jgi:transcription elongation factor GreA